MKTTYFVIVLLLTNHLISIGQTRILELKSTEFPTVGNTVIKGSVGYLAVPENRLKPGSRELSVKFVHLKSVSNTPQPPVIYLEGGGRPSTPQAENPETLTDWLPILKVSDLIFVDQRGTTDQALTYVWTGEFPENFFISAEDAGAHYQDLCKKALAEFERRQLDVSGYNIAEHANDIHDLTEALQIRKYSIFGFSFGSQIAMALMKLFPQELVSTIAVSTDAMDQSFNYPVHLDDQLKKITKMVAADSSINAKIPALDKLTEKVMAKLSANPITISVRHPLTGNPLSVKVGSFGLALILRLEIDDTNDIPAIPRLLYTLDQGDYTMLQWFVQKRIPFAIAVPGNGINQAIASGLSSEREKIIESQASRSLFGNVVNFPFYDARKVWPVCDVTIDTSTPLSTSVPTLFITGSLDCRTPVEQVDETMKGFSNAVHLIVENAGHEQAMWDTEIFDGAIPDFLSGLDVRKTNAFYKGIQFLPLQGSHQGHPSVK
ncbi:MAG TPA: alpha/beta hydrolase [Ohtaekwangia sp.]|nr:alpha/beta hydrolase [Ohtaekwangia sp.]